MAKFFIIGTLPSSLYNFRGQLIKKICCDGYIVNAFASGATESDVREIQALGAEYHDYPVSRAGLNPIEDLKTTFSLYKFITKIKPDYILSYTIKPIIWGGLAAKFAKCDNFFCLVTGLGYAFQPSGKLKSLLTRIVQFLYKYSLKNANAVIFQNLDNMQVFIDKDIVPSDKCFLVNGSGVDLLHFKKSSLSLSPNFLLIARLLGDKGIREYVEAAKLVKQQYPQSEFHLVGPEDPSPNGISLEEVNSWHNDGIISYLGSAKDVRPFIRNANIFVLPSYHEGMPRTVLEAMAMGRPILTTNVPGCKETVVNGVNGWLVDKSNVEQLAERMIWFIEHPERWEIMGEESYRLAKEKFDVHKVNAELLRIMGLSNETIV